MDLYDYLVDYARTAAGSWWRYNFRNGHGATVILEPHDDRPFRFEVESTDPDDLGSGRVVGNLTTDEVEAKLTKLAALPQNEDAE